MGKQHFPSARIRSSSFTRNPRGSRAKPLDLNDAQKLNELAAENHFAVLLAHAPYTINPLLRKRRHPHIRPRNDAG